MAVKMKNCKACGKEVAPSAKVCPSCGAKLKMGFGKKLLIGIGVLIVLGIIGSVSSGGKGATTTSSTPSSTSVNKPAVKEPTTEGTSSNVNIKVLEVTTPEFTGRDTVKQYPQGQWVVVKLSVQNNQKDAITVTSSDFKLLDKDKREFSVSTEGLTGLEMTGNKTLLLTTVNPGNTVEGYLAYDVPKGLTGFTMQATGGMTGTPIILKIN